MNKKTVFELKSICRSNNIPMSRKGISLRKNQLIYAINKYKKQYGGDEQLHRKYFDMSIMKIVNTKNNKNTYND